VKTVKRRTSCFLLLAILLLAAGLRFYRLDAQSLWNDEGNSARIAERPLDLILEGAAGDIHPPGYYLLLHYWRALFGQSEFALRSLSVVAGLALILLTYLLGRHLFGQVTGLTAAFLGALSPFAIYYSQEARMYILLAALSAASTYLFLRLLVSKQRPISNLQSPISNLQSPTPGIWHPASKYLLPAIFAAYTLTSAAGLYTHYAFPFVLLVHNAVFGLWWLVFGRRSAHRWQWLTLWAGSQAAIAVLYLPWLPIALNSVTGWPAAGRTYELGSALLDVLCVLTIGITLPAQEATASLVGAGCLLLVGLWPALPVPSMAEENPAEGSRRAGRTGWFGVASAALYLLLPIALIFAFDLYKPAWLKFLVVVLPPFCLLVAHGIENVIRFVIRDLGFGTWGLAFAIRLFAIGFLIVITIPSLHNLYFNPAYARDDYRQIAADIAAISRPGDGIILNAPNQWEVFTYYYPDRDVYPVPYQPRPDEVEAFLTPLLERYRRLFVLYWGDAESDPRRLIETWLAGHAYKAGDHWYGRVRLATYGVTPLPEEHAVASDVHFGEAIRLRGYTLEEKIFAPDEVLSVMLFWEAQAPIAEQYKITVQLLDSVGQLVAQVDTEPRDGLVPTTTWKPGHVMTDRYGILLPADLPSGRYTLIVALYHIVSGERLPAALGGEPIGDYFSLGGIDVGPAR
jgi:mannosyltransferase